MNHKPPTHNLLNVSLFIPNSLPVTLMPTKKKRVHVIPDKLPASFTQMSIHLYLIIVGRKALNY